MPCLHPFTCARIFPRQKPPVGYRNMNVLTGHCWAACPCPSFSCPCVFWFFRHLPYSFPPMFSLQEEQTNPLETCTCVSLGRAKPRLIISSEKSPLLSTGTGLQLVKTNQACLVQTASSKCHLEVVGIQFLFIQLFSVEKDCILLGQSYRVTCHCSLVKLLFEQSLSH